MPRTRSSRIQPDLLEAEPLEFSTLLLQAQDVEYSTSLRTAFEFFRRNADGRYSDTTLMNLNRSWDTYANDHRSSDLPVIVTADIPYTYDEETEVKRGGRVGMMVIWQDKTIVAVSRIARRRGVGTKLWSRADYYGFGGRIAMWVGRANTVGHIFCLNRGLLPTAMNGQGAVRYQAAESSDE